MRNFLIGAMVAALIGFATTAVKAAGPVPVKKHGTNVQLAAHFGHHGHHGHHHRWHRPHVYHPRPVVPHPGRVIVRPRLYHPHGAHYYGYPYYYGPRSGFQYYGPGGGISIGW